MHNKKLYKCALGKRGITKNKREGDKKTPAGVFSLGKVFYRKDKIKNLKTKLKKSLSKRIWHGAMILKINLITN